MEIFKQLIGRLHPLLVHLPIGFIILGLLLQLLDRKQNANKAIIRLIYLWAGICAILACITGYFQYTSEGYAFETIELHLYLGVSTVIFSFLMYMRIQDIMGSGMLNRIPILWISLGIFFIISFTGHLGGNITHGEGYLTEPLPNSIKAILGIETYEVKSINLTEENWEQAILYEDVVKPILNNKCVSCHNPKKDKGKLRLHSSESILLGGESGEIVMANHASKSELYLRMVLPKEDDDHMPPKEKTQPTVEEIQVISEWIDKGISFDKSIGELEMNKDLFLPFFPQKTDVNFPENISIEPVVADSINKVKNEGFHVEKISDATNFIRVSCINKAMFTDKDFKLITPLSRHIAILDLGGTQISDSIFAYLATLPNLTVLKLDHTKITGKAVEKLSTNKFLKSINLSNTLFEEAQIQVLAEIENLKAVYLYGTKNDKKVKVLKKGQIIIDYGGYELPVLPTDSIIY